MAGILKLIENKMKQQDEHENMRPLGHLEQRHRKSRPSASISSVTVFDTMVLWNLLQSLQLPSELIWTRSYRRVACENRRIFRLLLRAAEK